MASSKAREDRVTACPLPSWGSVWLKEYELWASGMPACGSLKTGSTQEGFSLRVRGPQREHLNGSQKLLADVAAAEGEALPESWEIPDGKFQWGP